MADGGDGPVSFQTDVEAYDVAASLLWGLGAGEGDSSLDVFEVGELVVGAHPLVEHQPPVLPVGEQLPLFFEVFVGQPGDGAGYLMDPPCTMSVDQVVAHNLRQLLRVDLTRVETDDDDKYKWELKQTRNDRPLSLSQLGDRMGVTRYVVYDMLRPRQDGTQRAFEWNEIVRLAVILDRSIFELVMPPDGVRWVTGHRGEVPEDATGLREAVLQSSSRADRARFAADLLGIDNAEWADSLVTELLPLLRGERQKQAEAFERIMRPMVQEAQKMAEQLDSLKAHYERLMEEKEDE